MHFNGAVYYQEMNEYQAFYKEIEIADDPSDPSDITDTNLVANTDAISIGAELELKGFINENWLAGLLLSHNDFKFADGEEGFCNDDTAFSATNWVNTCNVGGSRVGDSPNWNLSVNSEYTLSMDDADFFVRGLYSFSSASYQPALPDADSKAGSHGIVDIFTGLRSKDGDWEASLWAKNLMDKEAETERRVVEDNGYREIAVVDERTIGLSLRYNFSL
jgi:outer membrane receptor for ferric coprogen and ferric-rhodotorulic acid